MRPVQNSPSHNPISESRWHFRTQHPDSLRPTQSPESAKQLAHWTHPRPLWPHQPQNPLPRPQLLRGFSSAFALVPPPPPNPRLLLQQPHRSIARLSHHRSRSALLSPARLEPVHRTGPGSEPVVSPNLQCLRKQPYRGNPRHSDPSTVRADGVFMEPRSLRRACKQRMPPSCAFFWSNPSS